MNEILLFFAVIICLMSTNMLVSRVGDRSRRIIRICGTIIMLLLIWVTFKGDGLLFRIMLTILTIGGLYAEFSGSKKTK